MILSNHNRGARKSRTKTALVSFLTAVAMAGIVGVGGQAAHAATNLITDGQFNDTSGGTAPGAGGVASFNAPSTGIPGWTVTSGSVDWINGYWNGPSSTDTYTIDLNGFGPGTLEQQVATMNGKAYTLSFDLSANPNCEPNEAKLEVDWNGTAVGEYAVTPTWDNATMAYTPEWVTVTGTGATAGDVLDFIGVNSGACGPVIGDVSLVPNLISDGEFNQPSSDPNFDPTSAYYGYTEPNATSNSTVIPGWTILSPAWDTTDVGSVDWQAPNYGNWSGPSAEDYTIDMNGSTPGQLEQKVTTTSGQDYTLAFELSANNFCGEPTATLEVDWNGASVGTYSITPSAVAAPASDYGSYGIIYTPETISLKGTGADTLDYISTTGGMCGPVIADVSLTAPLTGTPPANTSPTISAPAAASATYDRAITPITVTGSDTDADTVTLAATNVPTGLSFDPATGKLSGTPTVDPGNYTITFSANDGVNTAVTTKTVLTVHQDTCTITNPATILSSASAATPLTATITQSGTTNGLTGKEVDFALTDSSSNPYGPYPSVSGTGGVATYNAPLPANVYSMNASFPGDTDYSSCATTSATLVTVSPASYKVTGGGWFSNGTGRTSFGFNVVPSVTGTTGQLQLHTGKGDFHGNTVTSLSQPAKNSVTWTGTGRWGTTPATFTVTVVDNGTGGSHPDTINITITAGSSVLFTTSGPDQLKGGNITVH